MIMRWPLHPALIDGECLTSWLQRIGICYGLGINDLLKHALGFPYPNKYWLDVKPPQKLLEKLAKRTGVRIERIRQTSVVGLMPFLFACFDTNYFRENSVLFAPAQHLRPTFVDMGNWIRLRKPEKNRLNACRACLNNYPNASILLPWRLTLMLSCPSHGLMLEQVNIDEDSASCINDSAEDAPASIRLVDYRTWKALISGLVELPGGFVTAERWFLLLRTICSELNRPLYKPEQQKLFSAIWAAAHNCIRQTFWNPVEELHPYRKRSLLLATAIDLMEKGLIYPHGIHASLFRSRC